MGFYIDPHNSSKEQFLADKGKRIDHYQAEAIFAGGTHLPVCLVDNPGFSAAGICYSLSEIEAFKYPGDPRPKAWFSVSREDLAPFYTEAATK